MKRRLILVALIAEGGLLLIALALGPAFGLNPLRNVVFSREVLFQSILLTIPLLAIVLLIERIPSKGFNEIERFMDDVVRPLFAGCTVFNLAWLSLLAGVAEEAFFRGFLQDIVAHYGGVPVGLLAASIVFGAVHAVTPLYALVAGVIGLYLGWTYIAYETLSVPIAIHALYDFILLLMVVRGGPEPSPTA